jgi:hypothetical protein
MKKFDIEIELRDFTQAEFEKYQPLVIKASRAAYVEFDNGAGVSATSVIRGETVRAAIVTGFLTGVTVEQVAGMKPYVVTWIADEVAKHVKKVTTEPIDPN